MLIGEIGFKALEQDHHAADGSWFRSGYLLTKLDDPELLAKVRDGLAGSEILIFLGTWCGDTREYVPEFAKILDDADFPRESIRLLALDRDKKLEGWTDRYSIQKLPTLVVLRNGRELGRITESPEFSLLEDLAAILERHPR